MQAPPEGAFQMPPPPPDSLPAAPARSVKDQIGELFRYTWDGFKGVGV
jgi:hypothetical protein